MTAQPRIGELLLGIEGLALLRLSLTGEVAEQRERVNEIRLILQRIDDSREFAEFLNEPEYNISEGYQLWSETYDRPLRLFPIEEPIMHRLLDTFPPSLVLDAACGTGRYSVHLFHRGHQIIGVDQSPAMLARAKKKLPSGDFRRGDLSALPLDSGSVDGVVCALSMIHLNDIEGAISELARVVRPGGRVIISDVHPFLILLGWRAQFRAPTGNEGFMRLNAHLPSDYCHAFTAAGLHVRTCYEPLLTEEAAVTFSPDHFPDANRAAFGGLPGVIVWDTEKQA